MSEVDVYVAQALPSGQPTSDEIWARAKSDPEIFRRLLVEDGWEACPGWSGSGGGWMTQEGTCTHTEHHVVEARIIPERMVGRGSA